MTHPSTSKNNSKQDFKRKERKVQIIILAGVCPILIALAILIGLGVIVTGDEKAQFKFEKTGNYPEQLLEPNEIIYSTNLFNLELTLDEEIGLVEEIFSRVNLKCMNVNWYGTGAKQQIFYNESVTDIQQVFKDLEITFEMVDQAPFIHFISNPVMQVYVEVNCQHVWSIDLVPPDYDPEFDAMSPYISCRDHPFFTFKDYCNLLPRNL